MADEAEENAARHGWRMVKASIANSSGPLGNVRNGLPVKHNTRLEREKRVAFVREGKGEDRKRIITKGRGEESRWRIPC